MPLYMIHDDITRLKVDAIVDPTDCWFSGSGGADYAIHRAAGPELEEVLRRLPPLETGKAVVTPGFDLPAKHIIHTFGPIWEGGGHNEAQLLADCYRNCLSAAAEYGCRSIAFPVISGGTFGFPNDDALQIAKRVISEYLQEHAMQVFIVAYRRHTFNLGAKLFAEVSRFVDENYVELSTAYMAAEAPAASYSADYADVLDLEEMLRKKGETFSCKLDRLRDERGMSGPELYKKAWVHKSVYSKIMNNINYQPAKITAVAFALALELPWEELTELVNSAGYAMTHTSKFDIVIEYLVKQKKYGIEEVNAVLYELDPDLPLIGY